MKTTLLLAGLLAAAVLTTACEPFRAVTPTLIAVPVTTTPDAPTPPSRPRGSVVSILDSVARN